MNEINEILAKFEYNASPMAYEQSEMVQMLRNRETSVPVSLDKYK